MEKYKIDVDYILNGKNFTLKENNIPNICADRIDYSIRQGFVSYNVINSEEKDKILNSLTVYNGSFVFKDYETAKFFAEFFWKMDDDEYSGLKSAIMFTLSGKLFQIAIEKGYITFDDFFKYDDKTIIEKIRKFENKDKELKKYFNYLNMPKEKFENSKINCLRQCFCKVRKIDPQFISKNGLKRVSDVDPEFKSKLESVCKFREYFVTCKC